MKQSAMKKWELLGIVLVAFIVGVVGCPEAQNMMKPVVSEPADTTPPVAMGEVKKEEPEEEPAEEGSEEEPEEPADTTPPTVVEVAWYGDQQLEQPIVDDVHPGDTVYTVVTFSEPVRHVVADDNTTRPALLIIVDGKTRRYRMLPHGADLQSGEAQPLHSDNTDYLCKYTIPADTVGTLVLRVGSATADKAGNRVTEVSEHIASFVIVEPVKELPVIIEPVEPIPQKELTPQERAEEIVRRILRLHNEEPVINNDDLMTEVLERESGLTFSFIYKTLFREIYLEERPEEKNDPFSWYDTVLEYLRLGFLYPDASEKELLAHFRQSVKDGRVEIDPKKSAFIQKWSDDNERLRENIQDLHAVRFAIYNREIAALKQKQKDPSFDIDAERDKIFMEEAGLSFDFVHNTLVRVYLEAHPDAQEFVDSGGVYHHAHLISFYLLYKKTYEEESEEQILRRIKEVAARDRILFKVPAWDIP